MQRQIDATDKQIDGLAYELYGLTPPLPGRTAEEKIRIVEGCKGACCREGLKTFADTK